MLLCAAVGLLGKRAAACGASEIYGMCEQVNKREWGERRRSRKNHNPPDQDLVQQYSIQKGEEHPVQFSTFHNLHIQLSNGACFVL